MGVAISCVFSVSELSPWLGDVLSIFFKNATRSNSPPFFIEKVEEITAPTCSRFLAYSPPVIVYEVKGKAKLKRLVAVCDSPVSYRVTFVTTEAVAEKFLRNLEKQPFHRFIVEYRANTAVRQTVFVFEGITEVRRYRPTAALNIANRITEQSILQITYSQFPVLLEPSSQPRTYAMRASIEATTRSIEKELSYALKRLALTGVKMEPVAITVPSYRGYITRNIQLFFTENIELLTVEELPYFGIVGQMRVKTAETPRTVGMMVPRVGLNMRIVQCDTPLLHKLIEWFICNGLACMLRKELDPRSRFCFPVEITVSEDRTEQHSCYNYGKRRYTGKEDSL